MTENKDCLDKTDEELVSLSCDNQRFFLCIMKKYEHKLMRYIKRISGINQEDAEDILQEVFIKIYQNLNDFDNSLKFSSWAYRITHNHTISVFRKKKARAEGRIFEISDEEMSNISSGLDIEREMDKNLNKEALKKVLNKLDSKYREVIILKFLEERDYREISDIIKKPMGTVATLISRAKEKMSDEIKKQEIILK